MFLIFITVKTIPAGAGGGGGEFPLLVLILRFIRLNALENGCAPPPGVCLGLRTIPTICRLFTVYKTLSRLWTTRIVQFSPPTLGPLFQTGSLFPGMRFFHRRDRRGSPRTRPIHDENLGSGRLAS